MLILDRLIMQFGVVFDLAVLLIHSFPFNVITKYVLEYQVMYMIIVMLFDMIYHSVGYDI
jgi:hypothetical protein